MATYFTLRELTKSDTADRLGIDNTPSPEAKHNLLLLMDFLDDLRWQWTLHCDANELGSGKLRINSGYRCPELNKAVGGYHHHLRRKESIKIYQVDNFFTFST